MQKLLPIVLVIAFAWCGLSEAADEGLELVVQPEAILLDDTNIRETAGGGWEFNPLAGSGVRRFLLRDVELFYSLRNGSHEPIGLGLWTCSQSQNWELTVQWLSVGGEICHGNGVHIITLAPGQMHLGSVHVSVADVRVPAPTDRRTFRLKFISYSRDGAPDGRQWLSNKISVQMY